MQSSAGLKRPGRKPANLLFALAAILIGVVAGLAVQRFNQPLLLAMGLVMVLAGLAMFWRLEFGLIALVFISYIRLSDVLVQYHGAPSIAKLFVVGLLGLILIRWLIFRERPAPWSKAALLMGGYGLIILLSMFYAERPDRTVKALIDFAKDALIVLTIVMILYRGITLRRVVWALLAAGIFLGTITAFQALTGSYDNSFLGFAQSDALPAIGETGRRVAGPLSANYFALVLVALVPLALDRFWHEESWRLKVLAAWALVVSVISIAFTFSRGGFLALIVVLAIMIIYKRPKPSHLLLVTFGAVAILILSPSQFASRIATLGDVLPFINNQEVEVESSFRGRLSEVTVAWQMFSDHPIAGVGYNNFNNHYLEYSEHLGLDQRREDRSAHNLYLEIAAETGVIGLVGFLILLGFAFAGLLDAYRKFSRHGLADYKYLTFAFMVALIGYLTGSLFLHLAFARYLWLLLGIAFAIVNVAHFEVEKRKSGAATL